MIYELLFLLTLAHSVNGNSHQPRFSLKLTPSEKADLKSIRNSLGSEEVGDRQPTASEEPIKGLLIQRVATLILRDSSSNTKKQNLEKQVLTITKISQLENSMHVEPISYQFFFTFVSTIINSSGEDQYAVHSGKFKMYESRLRRLAFETRGLSLTDDEPNAFEITEAYLTRVAITFGRRVCECVNLQIQNLDDPRNALPSQSDDECFQLELAEEPVALECRINDLTVAVVESLRSYYRQEQTLLSPLRRHHNLVKDDPEVQLRTAMCSQLPTICQTYKLLSRIKPIIKRDATGMFVIEF